ncbi:chromate transporter [Peptoniphilus sp.]|uniref:chromate transporter n=1 Tax=Peptoniphilus sp. TaxID=1971214 RepID=UPI0039917C83
MILKLYLIFLKIGMMAFGGGYAVIPLINEFVVKENGWMTPQEFLDLISISQMTPGPIAINSATFVGQKVGGIVGSIFATAGVVTFQFILMMILGYFLFSKNKTFKLLDWMLNGIKAGVVSLILITAISLFFESVFPNGFSIAKISIPAAVCFVLGIVLYYKKVDLLKLIGMGAVLGIVLNYFIK